MMTGLMQDQHLEKQIQKQIGCMSGFLHIFDRQQILAGKRIYSTKRLPPSTGITASPEHVKSVKPTVIREIEKPETKEILVPVPESPDRFHPSPAANMTPATPPKSPLPLPMFELKEGSMKNSWKFCKEMPRLSLDSRAIVDSKGSLCPREIRHDNGNNSIDDKQRRSPSVIARLMGLDQLPSSESSPSTESVKKPEPELRRSASESRVSRDLFHSRFIDIQNFQAKQPNQTNNQSAEANLTNKSIRDNVSNRNAQNGRVMESMKYSSRNQKTDSAKTSQWRSPQQRRSFFDSADFFPEPKQTMAPPVYGDSEKNLKLRGIDEQSNDLETLKHILEALQLKGLLHSKRPPTRDNQRNFVHDPCFISDDSQIVLMKPWRSPASNQGFGNDHRRMNRYSGENLPSVSPRKERGVLDRNGRSPVRGRNSPGNSKSSSTIVKRKPLSIETQRNFHECSESRRNSPINSPKLTPKRNGNGSDYQSITNRSPRNRRATDSVVYSKEKVSRNLVMEDESSSFSESTGSSTSQSDPERSKMEEYREGKSLLERCDKLLHSIAEMNASQQASCSSVLPSPVSVLDSMFDKDESSSPSPVMKRSIDFKDLTGDLDDEIWTSIISPATSTKDEEFTSDDSDFTYISEILKASKYLPDDSSVFFFLEKQHYLNSNDTSKASKLQRKLIFDSVGEILTQNRDLPPWKNVIADTGNAVKQICSEFEKIREPETADNLLDLICGVLKRDLAGNNGWGDYPVEKSEAVLYIERLIFKDLVSEMIRDLADDAGKSTILAPRRKLLF